MGRFWVSYCRVPSVSCTDVSIVRWVTCSGPYNRPQSMELWCAGADSDHFQLPLRYQNHSNAAEHIRQRYSASKPVRGTPAQTQSYAHPCGHPDRPRLAWYLVPSTCLIQNLPMLATKSNVNARFVQHRPVLQNLSPSSHATLRPACRRPVADPPPPLQGLEQQRNHGDTVGPV